MIKKIIKNKLYTKVYIDKNKINLGKIQLGNKTEIKFSIVNKGVNPYEILNYYTSCDGISLKYNFKELLPGREAILFVSYNADIIGVFKKGIKIYGNTKEPLSLMLLGSVVDK